MWEKKLCTPVDPSELGGNNSFLEKIIKKKKRLYFKDNFLPFSKSKKQFLTYKNMYMKKKKKNRNNNKEERE